ncbi:peroxidase-like isoform X2 [Photinus pyralis]|uniref:peroxidase-like isoform X2 n=1 Tax=Photinus pyralis TaxID=7054 RepID=UPI001266F09B|nr:peroxidase-like isoform X2 [Photinus pyralis]
MRYFNSFVLIVSFPVILAVEHLEGTIDSNSSVSEPQSVLYAKNIIDHWERLERALDWSNIHVQVGSASHGQLLTSQPQDEALLQEKNALIAAYALRHLKDQLRITGRTPQGTPFSWSCSKKECLHSKYRPIDGSCSDSTDGFHGGAFSSYSRLLEAYYGDGLQEIRRSVHRAFLLPSARLVSTTISQNESTVYDNLTTAVAYWGRFIEHDMTFTASSVMVHSKKTIECCDNDGSNLSPRHVHPLCAPIRVPFDDYIYSKLFVRCIPYVRSIGAIRMNCTLGSLEQLNQASHFLDGSQLYGVEKTKLNLRRQFRNGLLKYSGTSKSMFLPRSTNPIIDCQYLTQNGTCYISGDSRVNELPLLTLLHTLWLREHNRIAAALHGINNHWNDEELFQETRRIVIALLQHITYNEWLPVILNQSQMDKVNSPPSQSELDPRTSNSFATAAIKFVNSLIDDSVSRNRTLTKTYDLKDYFYKPCILEENFDGFIRGMATQNCPKLDLNYADSIRNHLYQTDSHGFDIVSLDIQRGRDHGLPTYASFRSIIGYPNVTQFSTLEDVTPMEHVTLLRKVYQSPWDIDLIIGGMSERPLPNSLLGPTFSYIIGEQMKRTKNGDRYFYTNKKQPNPFTDAQLKEIQKVTLARIFCDNGDDIVYMQPKVFMQICDSNPLVSCTGNVIPHLNLKVWKKK